MRRKIFSILSLLLLWSGSVCAKGGVGVVMSGGGAKGLYHIGILEALEENGIPIDYVAGTSMGSIIAGLYASGYSPAEMRAIVTSGVVKEWVGGRIDPNKFKAYYRQFGQNPTMINVRLDLRSKVKKFHTPTNLVSATQINMALHELLTPASVASGGDFDKLMVPFLCVASDINARRAVVLRGGELSGAIRSSMSIPLVFKPMIVDSMLLYDGGIYDNFPWQALDKSFNPELIIGCICTEGNKAPSETNTILDQAFLLAMNESNYDLPMGRSVQISRAVDVSMLDFDNATATMNVGYQDAMRAMPELLAKVSERWTPEQYAERRSEFRKRCAPLIFDHYEFDGLSKQQQEFMNDFVKTDVRRTDDQREMPFDELRHNLFSVLASGDFTMEFPHMIYDPITERYTFTAKFATKPNFKISIGGNISSTAFNQAYIGLNYQTIGRVAQQFVADLYMGPAYTWGTFGGRTDFFAWKPVFIDYSFNFSVHNQEHGSFGNITKIDNTMDVKNSDIFFSLGAGMPLTHRSLFALRANGGHVNYHYNSDAIFIEDNDRSRFTFFGLKAEIMRNTFDKALHPRRGSDLKLSAIFVTGREKFQSSMESSFSKFANRTWFGARITWDKYFDMPGCDWFSLGLNVDAVVTNKTNFIVAGATLMSMPAYAPVAHAHMVFMPDLRASRFVGGGVRPTFDLFPNFFIRGGIYTLYRAKHGFSTSSFDYDYIDNNFHFITEASLVYHTPVGPVSLAFTKYDFRSWNNMYVTFNFGYAIFAPRGTFY